ncbi:MAG: nuclear transport factor 2 family protein, partial [Pseudomonadota bacterium]
MRRLLATLAGAVVLAGTVWGATTFVYDRNYAQDRSEIEDLQSRYLFALDWQKPELYASTFTPDGVLIWAG